MARNRILGLSAIAAGIFAAIIYVQVLPAAHAASGSRYGANYFPNVELTTQDGKKIHFYDDVLKGKTVAIDLIYTHCVDSCPLETARLVEVQKMLGDRMGKDVFFYSITIDPKRDTPEVLKAYMEKFHVGPGWTFLTGKKEDIDLISKKIGLYSDPDPNNRDGHAPGVLIGNEPTGQWLRNGATDNPRFLTNLLENWMGNWKSASQQTKPNYADAKPLSYDRGQYMFGRHCAACHTIGHGDKIGPDLLGVTNVRDRAWLTRFISTPDAVLAQKDPIATALFEKYKQVQMPNLREADEDVKAIIDFLASQSSVQSGTPSDKNQAAIAGTGQSGK